MKQHKVYCRIGSAVIQETFPRSAMLCQHGYYCIEDEQKNAHFYPVRCTVIDVTEMPAPTEAELPARSHSNGVRP